MLRIGERFEIDGGLTGGLVMVPAPGGGTSEAFIGQGLTTAWEYQPPSPRARWDEEVYTGDET